MRVLAVFELGRAGQRPYLAAARQRRSCSPLCLWIETRIPASARAWHYGESSGGRRPADDEARGARRRIEGDHAVSLMEERGPRRKSARRASVRALALPRFAGREDAGGQACQGDAIVRPGDGNLVPGRRSKHVQ